MTVKVSTYLLGDGFNNVTTIYMVTGTDVVVSEVFTGVVSNRVATDTKVSTNLADSISAYLTNTTKVSVHSWLRQSPIRICNETQTVSINDLDIRGAQVDMVLIIPEDKTSDPYIDMTISSSSLDEDTITTLTTDQVTVSMPDGSTYSGRIKNFPILVQRVSQKLFSVEIDLEVTLND